MWLCHWHYWKVEKSAYVFLCTVRYPNFKIVGLL